MNFIKEKIKDFFLLDTKVENIFINEYMPSAPGDFVKVYLYASMYAEHGLEITEKAIAKQLGLSEEKVREAWEYWEERGVIRKRYFDTQGNVSFIVEFLSLKEQLYGKNTAPVRGEASRPKGDNVFGNPEVKVMFKDIEKALGRTLDSSELGQIMKWLTDYGASPEVVFTAVKYSIDKNKTSMRYIESVVKGWTEEGLQSTDQISEKLQEMDEKYYRYRRVLDRKSVV